MLADPEITLVVNLTVPLAHAAVSKQIVEAGKSVYSEKPLAARFADAAALMQLAEGRGVRIGCAPDTFMGASHQACRRALDAGVIGNAVGGAAVIMGQQPFPVALTYFTMLVFADQPGWDWRTFDYFRDTLRGMNRLVADLELNFLAGLHDVSL